MSRCFTSRPRAEFAFELLSLTRFAEPAAKGCGLRQADGVFRLAGAVTEPGRFHAGNGVGVREQARLPDAAFGGLDPRLGFGEFRLEPFRHVQGLVQRD